MSSTSHRLLVALDFPTLDKAGALAYQLHGKTGFKVGLELNTAAGTPEVVKSIGTDVFLDLKFHDIPNTVAGAVKAAAAHKVLMLNVHCLGGEDMMRAAAEAGTEVYKSTGSRPWIIGVTILTSHDLPSLKKININANLEMEEIVLKLAQLAAKSGLDGVVCSPWETNIIRQNVANKAFIIVNPGIRSSSALVSKDDQKRTMTASEAIMRGADYLVIGRPITAAANPVEAANGFLAEISWALERRDENYLFSSEGRE